ncbi:hypothetical protein P4H42_32330, partial [Paenibacillus macerans]|uniref:hypothetical protein n=1 Tax=Paenibacillus macerans TaxID=44252 RepID=UPI002DBE5F81
MIKLFSYAENLSRSVVIVKGAPHPSVPAACSGFLCPLLNEIAAKCTFTYPEMLPQHLIKCKTRSYSAIF